MFFIIIYNMYYFLSTASRSCFPSFHQDCKVCSLFLMKPVKRRNGWVQLQRADCASFECLLLIQSKPLKFSFDFIFPKKLPPQRLLPQRSARMLLGPLRWQCWKRESKNAWSLNEKGQIQLWLFFLLPFGTLRTTRSGSWLNSTTPRSCQHQQVGPSQVLEKKEQLLELFSRFLRQNTLYS